MKSNASSSITFPVEIHPKIRRKKLSNKTTVLVKVKYYLQYIYYPPVNALKKKDHIEKEILFYYQSYFAESLCLNREPTSA